MTATHTRRTAPGFETLEARETPAVLQAYLSGRALVVTTWGATEVSVNDWGGRPACGTT